MEYLWIIISMFGALMQAVRTAAQKTLNQRMSNLGTTYVRSVFGLPLMLAFLAYVLTTYGGGWPKMRPDYLLFTAGGAAAQLFATMALIYMFKLRNFAIGTMLTKVDILMTAVIGTVLFSETLSVNGVIALVVVVSGVLLMTVGRMGVNAIASADGGGLSEALFGKAMQVAFLCALLFTFSYLFLREALLVMEPAEGALPEGVAGMFWRSAWTVVIATMMQTAVVGVWLWQTEPKVFSEMRPNFGIATFIGVTSALGSIGWYTAFAMQNASYVRAVGQIEVVFTLLIAWFYFRERMTGLELAGVAMTVVGILMFRLIA
jgi:drug/metabolite transporter (DMT)-like permease